MDDIVCVIPRWFRWDNDPAIVKANINSFKLIIQGYEVVIDSKGNIVTDPLNAGTYNFYNPSSTNPLLGGYLSHNIFDVEPYYEFGNSTSDISTQDQREGQKYITPFVYLGINWWQR